MKQIFGMIVLAAMVSLVAHPGIAQKVDTERMTRDIEVAENVLGTLIKQQFNNQRTFFPLEINGNYQEGYGVTFSLPADFTTPIVLAMPGGAETVVMGRQLEELNNVRSYSFRYNNDEEVEVDEREPESRDVIKLKDKAKEKKKAGLDSIKEAYNTKVIDAAKMFLVDYGDMITQLGANERIVITNQGSQPRVWVNQYFSAPKRTHLTIEVAKSDLAAFRQGKMSREQALSKIKVVNTTTVDEAEPDLELLTTMFNRLYSQDLSKTFFAENNIYYERLKDFGAIYYMSVFSSHEVAPGRFRMPTLNLNNVDMEERNAKVKQLYPKFEQEFKENMVEYGRTIKSLKDDESLIFQVKITRCPECGIPSTLEYAVKGSVLRDLNTGKIDKGRALNSVTVKKGPNQ